MQPANVKAEAHRLVDELPQDATWEDLMYKIYVRQAIEAGLEDSEADASQPSWRRGFSRILT